MKKSVICIALAAVTLAACNNTEKEARARLNNAKSMYERNELFAGKKRNRLYPRTLSERIQSIERRTFPDAYGRDERGGTEYRFLRQPYSNQNRRSGRTEKGIRF